MLRPEAIEDWLRPHFPEAQIDVVGDDSRHFSVTLTCHQFDGLSVRDQHRLVYQALGDKMHTEIHALSIQTHAISTMQSGETDDHA